MNQGDIEWAGAVLARRRAVLALHAPLYWRPAADADERHTDFLRYLLGDGGGIGCRTDESLMLATPGRHGWTIDDADAPPGGTRRPSPERSLPLDTEPRLDGASASLVPAPPVYDPGGLITFVRDVLDVTAIGRARDEAVRCGSPLVVVDQPAGADDLG